MTAPAEPAESPHMWLRAVLTSIAFVALVPVAIVLLGGYLPGLPLAGRFGAFVMENAFVTGTALVLTTVTANADITKFVEATTFVRLRRFVAMETALVNAGSIFIFKVPATPPCGSL